MADFKVIAPLAQKILDASNAWSGVAGQLTAVVVSPIVIGASLLVIWHGINILRGAGGQHHALDAFVKCVRAILVVGLAISAGAYSSNIVGFFQEFRSSLTGMFVSGSTTSYDALDSAVNQAMNTWDPTWNWATDHIKLLSTSPDVSGVVAIICWFLMMGALVIFAAICGINLIVIDFALAFIFAVGPMFVACFAFQSTQRFTDGWLGAALKYTFTAIVISAVVGLGLGILQSYAAGLSSSADAMDFVSVMFSAIGASLILCVLAYRVPQLAGDVVGGVGIAAFGPAMAARPIQAVADVMRGGASVAGNAAAYGAGRLAGSGSAQVVGNSTIGSRVAAAFQANQNGWVDAVRGRGVDSQGRTVTGQGMRNAFNLGRGNSAGTGVITGGGRPVDRVHSPGGA
ncbi:MAG: hypothetical protein DI563_05780 [Variovorax paradoxus]|uniref:Conjugal transfer protein TrbL n=1 Tax=Variovorax paradoxus TaxID=34073 RepID=A0A2W5QIL4_VARPD|nr:MAG: hypothetical protein DI563_05780 [Variovorax paradoxus]